MLEPSAKSEEVVEILTTEDERIKSIGEIFANDTSRRILMSIFEGVNTAGDLASRLGISLPLSVYHLKRLEQAGLIKVCSVRISSKQQKVNQYVPMKLAFVLIPSATATEKAGYRSLMRKVFDKLENKFLLPISFALSSLAAYLVQNIDLSKGLNYGRTPVIIGYDPLAWIMSNIELILAVSVGGIATYTIYRIKGKTSNKKWEKM
jgi:DNA-binding transcriptional ArsR family regulator